MTESPYWQYYSRNLMPFSDDEMEIVRECKEEMELYSKETIRQEKIKCARNPGYFFHKYVKIKNIQGKTIPFIRWAIQDVCLDGQKVIQVGRRTGISTLVLANVLHKFLFDKSSNFKIFGIINQNYEINKRQADILKQMMESLPNWLTEPISYVPIRSNETTPYPSFSVGIEFKTIGNCKGLSYTDVFFDSLSGSFDLKNCFQCENQILIFQQETGRVLRYIDLS